MKTQENETYEQRLEIEKKERKELTLARVAKIESVVKCLKGFTFEAQNYEDNEKSGFYYPDNVTVIASNGKIEFMLRYGYNAKGKIALIPCFNRDNKNNYVSPYGYNESRLSINISLDKEPALIAKQIESRFFPECIKLTEKVNAIIAKENTYFDATRATLEYIAGKPLTDKQASDNSVYVNNYLVKASGNNVSFDIRSVSKELGKQILDLLNSQPESES